MLWFTLSACYTVSTLCCPVQVQLKLVIVQLSCSRGKDTFGTGLQDSAHGAIAAQLNFLLLIHPLPWYREVATIKAPSSWRVTNQLNSWKFLLYFNFRPRTWTCSRFVVQPLVGDGNVMTMISKQQLPWRSVEEAIRNSLPNDEKRPPRMNYFAERIV